MDPKGSTVSATLGNPLAKVSEPVESLFLVELAYTQTAANFVRINVPRDCVFLNKYKNHTHIYSMLNLEHTKYVSQLRRKTLRKNIYS